MQIDEETFNKDIKEIEGAIYDMSDNFKYIESKLKILELCEYLMESYNFIENNLNDMLNSITFARLKIIHSSIIKPIDLINALQEISQSLKRFNLPLTAKMSNIALYLDIIELEAFQTDSKIIFILKIPLLEPEIYTLYELFPLPIKDKRTGLFHVLLNSKKYIAKADDSLLYVSLSKLNKCKSLGFHILICSNIFPYPIDTDAICEAQILKNPQEIPKTCQNSIVYVNEYSIQELEANIWLTLITNPLPITIKCTDKLISEIISKNSIIQLQPNCIAFIGSTKIQAKYFIAKYDNITYNIHSINIPFECCEHLPEKTKLPKIKPLKIGNLNNEDLEIARYKLDEYSRNLDKIINEPFVKKHISWFTYLTISLIILLLILYICCKCISKRKFKIGILAGSSDQPPAPPGSRSIQQRIRKMFPRKRPSINLREDIEDENIELNSNLQFSKEMV